jgi:hypothetical protein
MCGGVDRVVNIVDTASGVISSANSMRLQAACNDIFSTNGGCGSASER